MPRNVFAHGLAVTHFAFWALLAFLYFGSPDPERDMVFILAYFVDPWFIPVLDQVTRNPILGFAFIMITGSAIWWLVGFQVMRLVTKKTSRISPMGKETGHE